MKLRNPNDRTNRGKIIATPVAAPTDTSRLPPAFCLDHLVKGFCISDCDAEQKAALADALLQLSKRTWVDLTLAGRHGVGTEKIVRTALNVPIPGNITDDVTFLVFRFWGKAPMIGYRDGRLFHIVWIDPKRAVYGH